MNGACRLFVLINFLLDWPCYSVYMETKQDKLANFSPGDSPQKRVICASSQE